jgi:ParB-like chromosome segregation protein Spo0J
VDVSDETVIWRGPDELRPFLKPIDTVQRHPRNPRRGDVALVADSLDRYGQTRPIVVWQPDERTHPLIVAGNHTWQAARRLGWTHIAALADPNMTEDEATDFLLMDNASSDRAEYDDKALLAKLQALYDRGALAGTGFTPDDLDDMVAAANVIPETAREEFQGGFAETPEEEAARAAQAGQQQPVKQLPLSYDGETFRRVSAQLAHLSKHYETSGVVATVTAAVEEQFAEVWDG